MSAKTASTSLDFAIPPQCPQSSRSSASSDSVVSNSSSSSEEEAALDIREKAFELLNKAGGPESTEDRSNWPQRPSLTSPTRPPRMPPNNHRSSHPTTTNAPSYGSYQNSSTTTTTTTARSQEEGYYYQNDDFSFPRSDSFLGMVGDKFVVCVTEACKLGASEIISQHTSFVKSGYQKVRGIVIPEVEEQIMRRTATHGPAGTYQTVDLPQSYQGRYSDTVNLTV